MDRSDDRRPVQLSRRSFLAGVLVSPLITAACGALPAVFTLSTPTPTEPRRVRVAMPNLDAFQFLSTKLHNANNVLDPVRHVKVELVPVDLSVRGKGFPSTAEVPGRYADALNAMAGTDAPDLVMTELFTLQGLASSGALRDLNPLLKGESWFKTDDFVGNSLISGMVRGKQVAIPLDLSIEALLYSRSVLGSQGITVPRSSWTWDQAIGTAKSLTIHQEGPGARAGFFVSAGSPNWLTMAWQRGAKVISDDGTSIDLTEPGTIAGLEFLVDLINVHKVSPVIDNQLPGPNSLATDRVFFSQSDQMWRALAGSHAAMGSTFVGGWAGVTADDNIKIGPFPSATHPVTLGFPGILMGIPKNAPDPAHSINALRGLLDAASLSMILPTRKGVTDLRKVQNLLLDSEAASMSAALETIRVLPGDFPLEALAVAQAQMVVPVLSGQKVAKSAAKEAQAVVQLAVGKLRG